MFGKKRLMLYHSFQDSAYPCSGGSGNIFWTGHSQTAPALYLTRRTVCEYPLLLDLFQTSQKGNNITYSFCYCNFDFKFWFYLQCESSEAWWPNG